MAIIIGTSGNDTLNGTTAADDIQGLDGHDILDGGSGNDLLAGGIGNDIYVYRPGSGSDVISEIGGGLNTIRMLSVIPANVLLSQVGTDLVVTFRDNSDQIKITGFFDPAALSPPIDRITFDTGSSWKLEAILSRVYSNNANLPTEASDTLTGTTAADTIVGLAGNDTISGDTGNDRIYGGTGNDSLFGDAGDDLLVGEDGNDLLRGSAGNDTLQGGTGDDTYAFAPSHGADVITDDGGFDSVALTANYGLPAQTYDPLSLQLLRSGGNLILRSTTTGSTITVQNHFNPNYSSAIEQIVFEDGTIWSASAIQNRLTWNNSNTPTSQDDTILGTAAAQLLYGQGGNDTVSGGHGDDRVLGDLGDDRLFGNQGDDIVSGGDGQDSLWGNAGNDLLDGGAGSDTYHFNSGDGHDVILESATAGDSNRLAFGTGIRIHDLMLQQDGSDLVISLPGAGDSIRLANTSMPGTPGLRAISSLQFADGLVIDLSASPSSFLIGTEYPDQLVGSPLAETIYGLGGDDSLFGNEGNDTLVGGTGNDQMNGGLGSDRYVFNAGDGVDRIEEMPAPGEANQVVFGAGIGYSDLNAYYDSYVGGVVVDVGTAGDRLILANSSFDPYGLHTVDSFVLGDGTVATYDAVLRFGMYTQGSAFSDWISGSYYADSLYGNGGDDSLYGDSGNDILAGGQGFDYLSGGAGDDTYVFNRGDGMDLIDDYAFASFEGNRVLFGEGITVDDLRLRIDVAVPVLEIAGIPGDGLRFSNFNPLDPNAPRSVETFEFADGTTLSYEQLIERGFYVGGTEGGDWLEGSPLNDRLYGYGGDDLLVGRDGNDTLIGGSGYDQLDGGLGDDTYVLTAGDGFDNIVEGTILGPNGPEAGGTDTVQLLDGYDPATTLLYRYGNDLAVRNGQTGDETIVREHFGSYLDGSTRAAIERISFADGTVWNAQAIASRVASFNDNMPTEGSDTIAGTPTSDYLNAMGGNDTVSGGQGDDQLIGGYGNDQLFGGAGNDSIQGETGNDTLAGGTGEDFLAGGAGNDSYLFNLGDGQDRIDDSPMMPGESNRVVFGEGIRFSDLHGYADYSIGGVAIDVGMTGDRLLLAGASPDPYYGPQVISRFQFADGTVATMDAVLGWGSYQLGKEFSDWLTGSGFADSLYGNGGDDTLYGDSSNDILVGGQGNDLLSGGAGDDTYVYNRGDGVDYIDDYAFAPFEGNRVAFGEGITADDLRLRLDGPNARIEIAGVPGDVLQFSNLFPLDPLAPRSVSTFEFADGSTLSLDALIARGFYQEGFDWSGDYLIGSPYNDRIYGLGGDDSLQGMAGNDTLVGGSGNDQLDGGSGNDSYVFAAGDGFDVIWEGSGMPGPEVGGTDTVSLAGGYDPATTMLERWGSDLVIRNGQTGDQVIVREHFGSVVDGSTRASIERISFADGTIWTTEAIDNRIAALNNNMPTEGGDTLGGTPSPDYLNAMGGNDTVSGGQGDDTLDGALGDDQLYGGAGNDVLFGDQGNDLLAGGTGDDHLVGGPGNDTYLFNLGDGQDRIDGYPLWEESDRVLFGEGIRFADLRAYTDFNYGALAIDVGNGGDRLLLGGAAPDPYGPRVIDRFQFSDGTVATFDAVVGYGAYQTGGAWNESLYGTQYGDSLYGNGGDDLLSGDNGNDILSGGQGNDWLAGGYGNDTYLFNVGDGVDFIDDYAFGPLEGNRVVFGSGIAVADLWLTLNGAGVKLVVGSAGDELVLGNARALNPQDMYPVETFEFADGSSLSFAQLVDRGFVITGTSSDDALSGTMVSDRVYAGAGNDTAYGYDGNDTLYGEAGFDVLSGDFGDDTLVGGADNDILIGGQGSDRYLFNPGDGMDFIDDSTSFNPSDDNRVVFGTGIVLADLRLRSSGTSGWLEIGTLGDAVHFSSFFPWDPAADRSVQTFEFADGTILTTDELLAAINEAPVVGGPLPDQVATEDSSWGLAIPFGMFLDPNGGPMTIGVSLADGLPLPSWLNFDATTQTLYGVPQNGDVGTFALRVTATDSLGAAASSDFNLTVLNVNDAPTVSSPLVSQTATEDSPFGYTVPADAFTDVDAGDSLTYMAFQTDGSPLPSWLGFDPMTRTFSGMPGNADVGTLNVRVKAFDLGLATAYSDFSLTVTNVNDAPAVGMPLADQAAPEDTAFSFTVPGDAFADIDAGDTLTLTATLADGSALPTWLSFDPATRTFAGTPANSDVGSLEVRVTATDTSGLSVSDSFVLTVANVNDAPVAASALVDQSANEDAPFSFTVPADAFGDVDSVHGDTLTFSASLADGSPLPAWLSFDAATRSFSGTPANGDVGSLAIRVTVTDSAGAAVSGDFALTVANTNDAPVAGVALVNQSVNEDSAFAYALPAGAFSDVDAMHGDTLTYTASLADGSPLPAWLGFDAATRTFSGSPGNGDVGTVSIRVTATDVAGAVAAQAFTLSVANVNDAPVVASAIPDQSAAEGQAFSYQLSANAFADVDAGDTLGFAATLADGSPLPGWLSFDAVTRSFSGNPGDGTAGDYTVRVTATDGSGVSVSDEFNLVVADSIATVITGNSSANTLQGTAFRDVLNGLGSNDTLYGYAGDDLLDGGSGSDTMVGGTGNDTYVVNGTGDVVVENANEGLDTVQSGISYTLGANVESLTLTGTSNRNGTGNSLDNVLIGNGAANTLTGNAGNDTLDGGAGTDTLRGGTGNDRYVFGRGYGADTVSENDATTGNSDTVALDVDALDVVFARSGSNLLMTLHGGTDKLTVGSWYSGSQYQTEVIETSDGQQLLNTQVDQLIQAMASFSATSGLTWDQAIDQRPQDVQAILTAYWQPVA